MPANESDRTIATVALSAFALSLVIHIITFFADVSRGIPITSIAFATGLVCWGALILTVDRQARERGQQRPKVADLVAPLPKWARLLCDLALYYSIVNFVLFMRVADGGTLEQQPDGRYNLSDHGHLVRTLNESGARAYRTREVRLISGHSLPVLLLPGFFFLFVSLRPERGDEVIVPAP
jgi:hypothetical protein